MAVIKGGPKVNQPTDPVVERLIGPFDIESGDWGLTPSSGYSKAPTAAMPPKPGDAGYMSKVASWLAVTPDTFPSNPKEAGTKLVAAVNGGLFDRDGAVRMALLLCQRNDDFNNLG